ncbi:MAG: hypothetical protein M3P04_06790 [Actinomycetota bacterium]|nr:hypothetical protein [Actinomycetota bacterium]
MSVTRFRATVVRRPSLPLTEQDEHDLERLRTSSLHREALGRLSGELLDTEVSESALLHAVFEAGLAAVRAASEEAGYAQMAVELDDNGKSHRSAARRRRPSWAHEE